jgi:hypothetical protein
LRRPARALAGLGLASFAAYATWTFGPFAWARLNVPVTFAEVDLNHDGDVTLAEADYFASSGSRPVTRDGQSCTEYFAYKDGLTLKVTCP